MAHLILRGRGVGVDVGGGWVEEYILYKCFFLVNLRQKHCCRFPIHSHFAVQFFVAMFDRANSPPPFPHPHPPSPLQNQMIRR